MGMMGYSCRSNPLLSRPPPSPGERWALVSTSVDLEEGGVPAHRLSQALIEIGYCVGPADRQGNDKCRAKLRQEKRRYQVWVTRVTGN